MVLACISTVSLWGEWSTEYTRRNQKNLHTDKFMKIKHNRIQQGWKTWNAKENNIIGHRWALCLVLGLANHLLFGPQPPQKKTQCWPQRAEHHVYKGSKCLVCSMRQNSLLGLIAMKLGRTELRYPCQHPETTMIYQDWSNYGISKSVHHEHIMLLYHCYAMFCEHETNNVTQKGKEIKWNKWQ